LNLKIIFTLILVLFSKLTFGITYQTIKADSWDKAFVVVSESPANINVYNINHHVTIQNNTTFNNDVHINVSNTGRLIFKNADLQLTESSYVNVLKDGFIMREGVNANNKKNTITIGTTVWIVEELEQYPNQPYTLSNHLSPLPVTLISFNVKVEQNRIKIFWDVASELDLSYYIVQMSYDGKIFNDVGVVNGVGTTSIKTSYKYYYNYSFTDTNRILYFRLVSVDLDTSREYHSIKTVRLNKLNKLYELQKNSLYLYSESNDIVILDIAGRVVQKHSNKKEIDISGLKGVYFLVIRVENMLYKEKIYLN
jgi:hypothetical protein